MHTDQAPSRQSEKRFKNGIKLTRRQKYLAATVLIVASFLGAWLGYFIAIEQLNEITPVGIE